MLTSSAACISSSEWSRAQRFFHHPGHGPKLVIGRDWGSGGVKTEDGHAWSRGSPGKGPSGHSCIRGHELATLPALGPPSGSPGSRRSPFILEGVAETQAEDEDHVANGADREERVPGHA